MSHQAWIAVAVFLITYGTIVSEKIHRTIIAMAGAAAVIALGIIPQETAVRHIDFNTIGLLLGMMIIVIITAETGLFTFLAVWSAKKVHAEPVKILVVYGILTAVVSAFLDNVTTVLLMTPVTFSICRKLEVMPIPILISQIIASNIGGTATLIGDPPNIMIGSAVKELTFTVFARNLVLPNAIVLVLTLAVMVLLYRNRLRTREELRREVMALDEKREIKNPVLLKKCLAVLAFVIGAFFIHQRLRLESATIALAGAFLLLLISNRRGAGLMAVLGRAEWTTIFFFAGLFIIIGGLVETGVVGLLAQKLISATRGNLKLTAFVILWSSAVASAFIDNIPFVATMIPLLKEMGRIGGGTPEVLWWSLSLGACLGGNGTLIGASANVIVSGLADEHGYHISFMDFLKVGFPLMLMSIAVCHVYIYLRYLW